MYKNLFCSRLACQYGQYSDLGVLVPIQIQPRLSGSFIVLVCNDMQDLLILASTGVGQSLFAYKLQRMELKTAHTLATGLLADVNKLGLVQNRASSTVDSTKRLLNKCCQQAGITSLLDQLAPLTAVWCDGPLQGVVWELDMEATRIIDGQLVLFRK
jgi:hypothetical protein